jgi:hypothetical protein
MRLSSLKKRARYTVNGRKRSLRDMLLIWPLKTTS